MKVVVVGGGIAGLSAAYRLVAEKEARGLPLDVTLVEASDKLGGVISTTGYHGAVVEEGPDSFITLKPWALDLCKEIGLTQHIISTNAKNRRALVAYGGKLHPIPAGFNLLAPSQLGAVFQSKLFSTAGKLRMAMELMVKSKADDEDESLASFVRRRLGQEVLERVAQPLAGGIYTADPEYLSLKSTMPRFLDLERKYGSVIRGLKKEAAQAKGTADSGARYSMFASLDQGMQLLVASLDRILGASAQIKKNCPVRSLERVSRGWRVVLADGTALDADAVIMALPAAALKTLLKPLDGSAAELISSIKSASSAVLNLIYRKEDIKKPLNGFGFVVPAIERRSIIACSFSSMKFEGRAPSNCVSLRVFMGGAMQPQVYAQDDETMIESARNDLKRYLGIKKREQWSSLKRWPDSMPQYRVGHLDLVKKIEARVGQLGGVFLAGNAFAGVGLPDCVRSGDRAARLVLDLVSESGAQVKGQTSTDIG